MRPRAARFALALVLLGLALLVVPAFGQSQPQPARQPLARTAPSAVAAVAPVPAQELNERLYLPALRDASISVVFGTTINPETGVITDPGTTFPAGIQQLYVNTLIVGYQGNSYRTDAIFADGNRETGPTRTATRPVEGESYSLCITTTGSCDVGTRPLPAGVYTIEVYINDQLVRSFQATLQ